MDDKLDMLNEADIYRFFSTLLNHCKEEGIYSVIEIAEKMGVSYAKVLEWGSLNENWGHVLAMCRCRCACRAENDWLLFRLPDDLGLKYCLENDDELVANYHVNQGLDP